MYTFFVATPEGQTSGRFSLKMAKRRGLTHGSAFGGDREPTHSVLYI